MRRRIRKFADRQPENKQTEISITEPLLSPVDRRGERANNRGDTTITEEDEEMN